MVLMALSMVRTFIRHIPSSFPIDRGKHPHRAYESKHTEDLSHIFKPTNAAFAAGDSFCAD